MEYKAATRDLTANEVADWFINRVDPTKVETITARQAMNLVYFAQAWFVTHTGHKLFKEEIEAWAMGPALPSIFDRFSRLSAEGIPEIEALVEFNKQQLEILDLVAEKYLGFETDKLTRLATVDGGPWAKARRGLSGEESSERIIPIDEMKIYYGAQIGKI